MGYRRAELRGREREEIMKLYWGGAISATAAALEIGVGVRQVLRDTPDEFVWSVAHEAFSHRVAQRALAKLRRKAIGPQKTF